MKIFKNKILIAFFVGLAVAALTTVISSSKIINNWHLKIADSLYTKNQPSDEIVIVAIDKKSFVLNPYERKRLLEYSRADYAEAIEKINLGKPKVIGIDILFSDRENYVKRGTINELIDNMKNLGEGNKYVEKFIEDYEYTYPADEKLADTIEKAGNVVPAAEIFIENIENNGLWSYSYSVFPLMIFDPDRTRGGIANARADEDNVVRRTPLTFLNNNNNKLYEHFSLKVLRAYFGAEADNVQGRILSSDGKDVTGVVADSGDSGVTVDSNGDPVVGTQFYKTTLGGKEIAIPLENGKMMINYFDQPYSFKMISYIDLINNSFDTSVFKDKIVLFGVTASDLHDEQYTPVSGGVPMPGVEIHANIIQTILNENYLRNQGDLSKIVTNVAVAVVAALVLVYTNIWLGIAVILAFGILYTLTAHFFYSQGAILNMVQPYLTLLTTYITIIIYRYFAELREKFALKGAFSHYVSKDVVKEVMKNPDMLALGGQKRILSVFFSDIVNFTHLSEGLKPEALVALINEYMDTMASTIMNLKGTLDKFEGDAIMAFFGAPLEDKNHAINACASALNCRRALHDLHEKWRVEAKPLLDFRVGISTGEAIVGNMGSRERFDYTAMGDTVNLGSRLEGTNKVYGTHIIVDETTYQMAGTHFEFRELDLVRVKGKDQNVRIYELVGAKGKVSPAQLKIMQYYAQGLALYRARNFVEALKVFEGIVKTAPYDWPSKIFAERCRIMSAAKNAPVDGWDGVFDIRGK